jgi:hypothetical protein
VPVTVLSAVEPDLFDEVPVVPVVDQVVVVVGTDVV